MNCLLINQAEETSAELSILHTIEGWVEVASLMFFETPKRLSQYDIQLPTQAHYHLSKQEAELWLLRD